MSPSERRAYAEALLACTEAAEQAHPMPASLDPERAALVEQLSVELMEALEKSPAIAEARNEYSACMERAGFSVGNGPIQSLIAARFEAVVGVPFDSGRGAFEALDEDQRLGLIEEERVAAVADVQCSIPLEDEWNRIGRELEARYLGEHPELGP